MNRHNFDQLDQKILKMLARDARKPYLEIARECGVSGASIHQRIQRLKGHGVIRGSECIIDPAAFGYETCAYVGLYLRDPSEHKSVVEGLEKIPEVVECYFTTGQYDMFVKLVVRNNDHLLQIIQDQIQSLGMARTETLICFKEVFTRQIPIK